MRTVTHAPTFLTCLLPISPSERATHVPINASVSSQSILFLGFCFATFSSPSSHPLIPPNHISRFRGQLLHDVIGGQLRLQLVACSSLISTTITTVSTTFAASNHSIRSHSPIASKAHTFCFVYNLRVRGRHCYHRPVNAPRRNRLARICPKISPQELDRRRSHTYWRPICSNLAGLLAAHSALMLS